MTEFEKMRNRQRYDFSDPEVSASLARAKQLVARLNQLTLADSGYRPLLQELIPGVPASAEVVPPFFCDHGHGIHLGEGTFVNFNCTMLDGAHINIGNHVLIGPNCQLYTPQHPTDYKARRLPQETALPITIGDDCWLGGGVIVCPGVTIGPRCIIAAGSVVTHDIPADSLAAGVPAMVKKSLADGC